MAWNNIKPYQNESCHFITVVEHDKKQHGMQGLAYHTLTFLEITISTDGFKIANILIQPLLRQCWQLMTCAVICYFAVQSTVGKFSFKTLSHYIHTDLYS